MNRHLLPLLFAGSILISCSDDSTPKDQTSGNEKSQDSIVSDIENTEDLTVTNYSNGATIVAMVDGPDEDFFIENYGDYDKESILNFTSLDIVPYVYGADDTTVVYPAMQVIGRDNFDLTYAGLGEYTGTINLYYDAIKEHLAINYSVKNGKPDGNCTLYDPEGNIIIERVYKNGVWQYSGKEPFSVDWTFDQPTASLVINDVENGVRNDSLVEIMHSFQDKQGNSLDLMIEKATFNSVFQINGEPFTGKLMAYQHPTYYDAFPEFELNFKDGLLHGDIKIYNWYGSLELHEIFENGVYAEEVFKMDESMMDGVAKPIIYIYPEEETEVAVNLKFDGRLTHTYPEYQHGWKVTASPDGTLIDEEGKEYYALYWEGKENIPLTIPNGTILKGSETIAFLEEELPKMGLNARETNEFIIFWMPYLENNPYNLIHFASDAYTQMADLNITPQPETMIRVMMVFQPLENQVEIQKQNLSELYQERKGFTVVEWGGRLLNVAVN
ncbi:hypothetical protein [Parvicella tangerina]|nr:hypothetical protein [Parvicella tangerina]